MILWYRIRFALICFIVVLLFALPVIIHHFGTQKHERIKKQIVLHIKGENKQLDEDELVTISETVYAVSRQHDFDYRLILALMKVESNFRHDAVSPMGARGLLQVKPSLAKFMARDMGIEWDGNRTIDDPHNNIKIGVRFLSELVGSFNNNINIALRAYNIGPERTRGLSRERMTSPGGFPGLVISEYNKNPDILPDP